MSARVRLEHFEAQVSRVACVTACACIALRARGGAPDQRSLHVERSLSGRPFDDLRQLVPESTRLTETPPDLVPRILVELASGRSVAVEVNGRRWMYLDPVVRARRATGTHWDDDGEFLHAIVLYDLEESAGRLMPEDEFLCLDPLLPRTAQPLRFSADDLRGVCLRAIVL